MGAVNDAGEVMDPLRFDCQDTAAVLRAAQMLRPFRAVIEATGTYRWLYDLLSPHGTVLLAHPLRLRAMIQRRAKTDKLDTRLLANLLRIDQIPLAYVPPRKYQQLRWILLQIAMHVVRADAALRNFYTRIRKRSSAKRARVALARKLGEICWKRLRRWHREHSATAA